MADEDGPKLLIVEDDRGLRMQLRWGLSDYQVFTAGSRDEALAVVAKEKPQILVLDLGLPPDCDNASEGLAVLRSVITQLPLTKVIVSSGNEERAHALEAMRLGAYDFYPKPVDLDVLKVIVSRAWNTYRLEEEVSRLRDSRRDQPFAGLVAGSPEMQRVCKLAERVAVADVSLLIRGESGTGKDVLARAIHKLSPRRDKPFIAINCAAIPENLLESELFGHEKGAFTGAIRQVTGKIELADGGTLFLDEIGDMPLALQAKLLRFLQDKVIMRVGGSRSIPVNVRVLSATNKDLEAMMAEKSFREDLYYRLNEVGLVMPPLRERPGDALLIARHLLEKHRGDQPLKHLSPDSVMRIEQHEWPGNVRELENRIKRAIVMAEGRQISPEDLDLQASDSGEAVGFPTLRQAREDAERKAVQRALALTDNNMSDAAKLLGISRPTLYDLVKSLKLARGE